jgi:hypothetical protein
MNNKKPIIDTSNQNMKNIEADENRIVKAAGLQTEV